jgi:hypothetical protein
MVQSLTPFHHAGRIEDSPLEGVVGLEPVLGAALRLRFEPALTKKMIGLVDNLFAGRVWNHQPIDVSYHDLAHTAQASRCYLAHVEGYLDAESLGLPPREFMLGLAAILFHDTGFLKAGGDDSGTGAKYTHSHVLRSSALAASLLPTLGFRQEEIEDILAMIHCTGLVGHAKRSAFRSDAAHLAACMVATSDFVGQMAAPDYVEKLPRLFAEFEEADDFSGVPRERRMFASAKELVAGTHVFWHKVVRPRLETEFDGVFRYLVLPHPVRRNPYFEAIERNLARCSGARG